MDDTIPRSIILLVILIILGGFFAGAETAFSYTNIVRMRMMAPENSRARNVVKIIDNFDLTVVTLLIVINVVHILASVIATSLFVDITGSTAIGPVVATIIITLAIFIFSETLPKNFAKVNCDSYALAVALPVRWLSLLLYPLAFVLTKFGEGVKKLFRLEDTEPSVTEDEFSAMVEDAGEDDVFEPEETEIIQSAIEFGDTKVRDIMTPAASVVAINVKEDTEELRKILIEEKYSRFPVYRGSRNNVVGVIRSSVALLQMIKDGEPFSIRETMVKPMFCSPDDEIAVIFERMCNRKNHFAVIRDEDERFTGIVTMEDILEEIVGEIYDEDDTEEEEVTADE